MGINTLSQSFSDTSGAQYTFSFWFAAIGDPASYFSASWDNAQLFSVQAPNTGGVWTYYSFTATGTGNDSILFSFVDIDRVMALDNVSVSGSVGATPEPCTLALFGSGALALFGVVRRN